MRCGMSCSRRWARTVTRALLEFYVSSGARASELLGVTLEDVDWGGQLIYVVSKGTRIRQPVPASPDAFRHLSRYLAAGGLPAEGEPVWRTRRGEPRPMTYWAMRRVLQRANERLGTNWTLHDARHTAATRMEGRGVASDATFCSSREHALPAAQRAALRCPRPAGRAARLR